MKRIAKIFLSYARPDEAAVRSLYKRLKAAGHKPWMDKMNLRPGERWSQGIKRAIKDSDFFFACLSANSVDRRGYIQREIRIALDLVQEKLYSDTYIVPVRLEDCEVPEALHDFQWVNLFERGRWKSLLHTVNSQMEMREEEKEPKRTKHRAVRARSLHNKRAKQSRTMVRDLALKRLALYQKLDELIYRTRNKAREVYECIRDAKRSYKDQMTELSKLKDELVEFMLNQKYLLDVFSCFDVVHRYKNVLVAFYSAAEVNSKPSKANSTEIENMFKTLDESCYTAIGVIKATSLKQKTVGSGRLSLKRLELYQRIAELAYRSKHKANDIVLDLQLAQKTREDHLVEFIDLLDSFQDLMFTERFFFDRFACFARSHDFKNALLGFYQLVQKSFQASGTKLSDIKASYERIEHEHGLLSKKLKDDSYK